jgi:polyhydroxybutyrate depolymerase
MRPNRDCARPPIVLLFLLAICPGVVGFEVVPIDSGRGMVDLLVPDSCVPTVPTPLVLLLHGYGSSGGNQEAYMNFSSVVDDLGFLYAYPDGTVDAIGNRFWNATDACCNFFGFPVDDSGYLRGLIDLIGQSYNLSDVYLVGHSNGGFMSYRMACDHSDRITAIASLAGATFLDPADCGSPDPVHVLQIHGTNDGAIFYNGGCIGSNCYPGAIETVEQWATFGGCDLDPDTSAPNLNLVVGPPEDDTTVTRYLTDCSEGGSGTLWTIINGVHSPDLVPDFSRQVVDFFYSHYPEDPVFSDGFESGDTSAWSTVVP